MWFYETKDYPALYKLRRHSCKRRWRLKKIIAVRRRGATPAGLRMFGWHIGIPVNPERFHQTYLESTYYSVRGKTLMLPICRLHNWAVDEVIGGNNY